MGQGRKVVRLSGRVRVYPRVKNYAHALPTINRVGFGRCPWAQNHTHTLPIRVGYPRVPMPMGKIAILKQ